MTGSDVSGTTVRKEDLWTRDLGTKGVCVRTGTSSRRGLVPTAGSGHEAVGKGRAARTTDAATRTAAAAADVVRKVAASLGRRVVHVLSSQVPAGRVRLGCGTGVWIVRVSLVVTQVNRSVRRALLHTGHSAARTGIGQTLGVGTSPC